MKKESFAAQTTNSTFIQDTDLPQVSVAAQVQDDDIVVTWSADDAGSGVPCYDVDVREDGILHWLLADHPSASFARIPSIASGQEKLPARAWRPRNH